MKNSKSLNIILIKTVIPLEPTSFIFDLDDGSQTTSEESIAIFNILKDRQYITNNHMVSEKFDYADDL